MNRYLRLIFVVALALVAATGCKRGQTAPETKMSPLINVAVAPFTIPKESSDLLAGYLPDRFTTPTPEALVELDAILARALSATPERTVVGASKAKTCMETIKRPAAPSRLGTLQYWQTVGKCADAQFLLVPMVSNWVEREGSAAGSTQPAWVILDLYLVNVKTGGVVNHFHYDYQQQALTDNILEAGKFFKRHGQWVTASELAREAIEQGLKELGL